MVSAAEDQDIALQVARVARAETQWLDFSEWR